MKKNFLRAIAIALLVALLAVSASALASTIGAKLNKGAVVVTTGKEHLRASADADSKSLGTVPQGTQFKLLADSKRDYRGIAWYKVQYKSKVGWISSKYTRPGYKSSLTLVATGKVNIRKNPSLDSKVVTTVKKGTTMSCSGNASADERGVEWFKVSVNGKTGWVSSKYVDVR